MANDSSVKAGEPLARLVGYKPLETEIAALQKEIAKAKADLEKATKDRDAAQTAGNKAGITTAENKVALHTKTVGDREGKLATKAAALDKFLIKAPADGKVTVVAKTTWAGRVSCTFGAPGFSASSGSVTTGRGAYSTSISSTASSAV